MIARWAAAAAVLGGIAWIVKAGVTLATGDEPPAAFAVGFLLFPFALLGLRSLLGDAGGRAARVGGVLAAVAAVSVVLTLIVRVVGGEEVEPGEGDVTLLTPLITVGGFGTFAALIALGLAVRRAGALAPRYASLPLAMGLGVFPLLIVGGLLEAVEERLLELPILFLGLAWIALGVGLWERAPSRSGSG